MTFIQLVISLGQIDAGKVSSRTCEYFGVFGCVLTPLGELQSAIQYVSPLPSMISGGKMAWRDGERFDMFFFFTAFALLLTNVNCGEI